jgi:hypothetical protein
MKLKWDHEVFASHSKFYEQTTTEPFYIKFDQM